MAVNQSFDITTGCDLQEVDNAVNQTLKELAQRFDFKGLRIGVELRRSENLLWSPPPMSSSSRRCGRSSWGG